MLWEEIKKVMNYCLENIDKKEKHHHLIEVEAWCKVSKVNKQMIRKRDKISLNNQDKIYLNQLKHLIFTLLHQYMIKA